eukprot:UN13061
MDIDNFNWQCSKCEHSNAANFVICEQCFTDKVDDNSGSNGKQEQKENKNTPTSSISAMFGNIKRYEYAEYVPPKIDVEEYFNVEQWKQRRMDAKNAKKKKTKVIGEVIENRKDTFKINKAPATITSKSFKLNLAMTEHFGLTIEEILAILEAAAPQSKLAAKLKEFLEIKMPRGFPIQLELPLFHVLKAIVTFQNFEHINPSADIFVIP